MSKVLYRADACNSLGQRINIINLLDYANVQIINSLSPYLQEYPDTFEMIELLHKTNPNQNIYLYVPPLWFQKHLEKYLEYSQNIQTKQHLEILHLQTSEALERYIKESQNLLEEKTKQTKQELFKE